MNEFNIKSEDQKNEIVNYLRLLWTGEAISFYPEHGICGNIECLFQPNISFPRLVTKLSSSWDKHSGYNIFPIPSSNHMAADTFYFYSLDDNTLWDGQQGDNRRELCFYMADKLDEMELSYE